MHDNIESHLVEKRIFKPARNFAKTARIKSLGQYRRMYRESIRQPAKFWTREAGELGLRPKMESRARMESAVCEVVRWRQTQYFGKLPGSASDRSAPEQGGNYLGGRTRRQTYAYLSTAASGGLPLRECLKTKQDKKGRSRYHLSSEHS